MLYTIPHYYNRFQCMAGSCPDTCCAGWEIAIDPKSLKKYRKMHGPLGNRLHNSIRWERGVFRQYGRRCAFLNEEGLCDLQAEGGEGMLCQTCRLYPRHVEEFEGVREISLSLSCIRAAQIILGCREPVRFLRRERESQEETFDDFDYFLYTKLTDSRDLALAILQNRTMDINVRMLMALSLAHDVQRRIQAGRLFEVDALLTRYGKAGAAARFQRQTAAMAFGPARRFAAVEKALAVLSSMEVLNPAWEKERERLCRALCGGGPADYQKHREEFRQWMGVHPELDWSVWAEQLMVYFLFTYYCGAVYDGRAYTRMKFAVYGTRVIQELAFGRWLCQGKNLSFADFADVAHCFSREVEHSDDNKNLLMDRLEDPRDYGMEAFAGSVLSGNA